MRLKDKVVFITGAASGIGRATALKFNREGAKVIGLDINEDNLSRLREEQDSIDIFKLDITDRLAIQRVVDEIIKRYGRIDCLVNNAGIYLPDEMAHKMSVENWERVINVDLNGSFYMTQAVLPAMLQQNSGVILFNSSLTAIYGGPGCIGYAAAKAAVLSMVKTLSKEYGKNNIRVNVVIPGFTQTPMTELLDAQIMQFTLALTPLGRLGKPEDIADAFLFLASEEASFITGQALKVSGGLRF